MLKPPIECKLCAGPAGQYVQDIPEPAGRRTLPQRPCAFSLSSLSTSSTPAAAVKASMTCFCGAAQRLPARFLLSLRHLPHSTTGSPELCWVASPQLRWEHHPTGHSTGRRQHRCEPPGSACAGSSDFKFRPGGPAWGGTSGRQ